MFQPNTQAYTQGFGTSTVPTLGTHIDVKAPSTTDNKPQGTIWLYSGNAVYYALNNFVSNIGGIPTNQTNWIAFTTSNGDVLSLSDGTTLTFPSVSGNIAISGTTNQITSTAGTSSVTLSIPSGFVAPGSITATTTITAGTTITATLGNITATNGNFVSSTAGKGLQFNANTATGVAASPVVLNSRAGQVVFTTVSIAADADLTLTITNSSITGSSTQIIYSMSGATSGSALSIKSVTNTAGSSAIVITNGTGATTTTSDITLNFIIVN